MDATAPPEAFSRAYHLCKKHDLYIVECSERADPAQPGEYVKAYVVYRHNHADEKHGIRLGRRRGQRALLSFVKKLTGEP